MAKTKRLKVGLALGSGGARGLAHVGVLKVLEAHGIPIDMIAGASAGSIIGGYYASKMDAKEVEKIVQTATWRKTVSLLDPKIKKGLIGGDKFEDFIDENVGRVDFNGLQIPFTAVATDVMNGEVVAIHTGNVARGIRASISFPWVFKNVSWKGRLLADGGLSMPVPVEIVRAMGADIVIAVNLDTDFFPNQKQSGTKVGYMRTANNSINILRGHLADLNSKSADVVLCPKTGIVWWSKLMDSKDVIKSGEMAALAQIKKIERLVSEA